MGDPHTFLEQFSFFFLSIRFSWITKITSEFLSPSQVRFVLEDYRATIIVIILIGRKRKKSRGKMKLYNLLFHNSSFYIRYAETKKCSRDLTRVKKLSSPFLDFITCSQQRTSQKKLKSESVKQSQAIEEKKARMKISLLCAHFSPFFHRIFLLESIKGKKGRIF